jgi:hypothetical protein
MTATANAPVYDAATVAKFLRIDSTAEQLAAFGPPPEPFPGYVTFFDPGWSIRSLRAADYGERLFVYPLSLYYAFEFARKVERPRYRQLRMEAVPGSFGKTFFEQQKLLPQDEEIPLPRVVVMGMVVHFLASRQRLFPSYWVRCHVVASRGDRVHLGRFEGPILYVSVDRDDYRSPRIGLASSRKV